MKHLLAAFLLALATTASADTLAFKVVGIDCAGCVPPVMKALKSVAGVANPKVDWKSGTASVDVPAGFDRAKLRTALAANGFDAIFAGEARSEFAALPPEVVKSLDIVSSTDGRKVDVAKLLAPGKVTIVDWYGEWCGPCKVLESRLQHYMASNIASNPGLALRRVDIGKWDNEAARQATREFRLSELPYVRIYDRSGKFVTEVHGAMWDEVLAAIAKASK